MCRHIAKTFILGATISTFIHGFFKKIRRLRIKKIGIKTERSI
jgi:hypothetical protein